MPLKNVANFKRIFKLIGLWALHIILSLSLLFILPVIGFDFQDIIAAYTINIVIMWEIYLKPIWRELKITK